MPKTLKNFIFTINVILLSSLFILVFIFTTYLHTSLAEKNAIKHANAVSNQVFTSMYQIMKRGWNKDDINEFMGSLKENFNESNYVINIYRGDVVKELFGTVPEQHKDSVIIRALETGKKETISHDGTLRNLLPLNAKHECLRCHVNAKVGDTLGVIEVQQDLINIIKATFLELSLLFTACHPWSCPRTTDLQISDVAHPDLIRRGGGKFAVKQIRGNRLVVL